MVQLGGGNQEFVDTVVIGSGFGGSVAAYRLAAGGQSVVLMERGKAYPPGSFARTPSDMGRNFWDPDRGLYGLFDAWTFRGAEGIVSSGLGGGSLIYANVLLRKDEKWFVRETPVPGGGYENWPFTRADLDPFYDAAEAMLEPVPYPYRDTPKTMAMEQTAEALGLQIQRPPIAVTFATKPGAEPGTNQLLAQAPYGSVHGAAGIRVTCTLCGECDIGCNTGAKNTLDHNYLSAAKHAGADIRTFHDVRGIRPLDGFGHGYEVRYVVHDPANAGQLLVERTIRAQRVVVAAGTFGTNFLLLRNRASLPGLSSALGTRFCGNGDLLTFVMGAKKPDDDRRPGVRELSGSHGPVITTAIRVPDAVDGGNGGRGYYVEDAGYPGFMNWLMETAQLTQVAGRAARVGVQLLKDRLFEAQRSNISADLAAALGDGRLSASSLPLLGMGRDIPDGVMTLQGGRLAINWTLATSTEYFGRVRSTMEAIARQLDGDFVDNPLWWAKRVITVHPLGGCAAADNPSEGVCDSYGEVFGYPGLYVVDGAAMPGPVGANPSLTIAAFAERACERILDGEAAGSRTRAMAVGTVPDESSAPRSLAPDATKGVKAKRESAGVAGMHPGSRSLAASPQRSGDFAGGAPTSVSFTEQMHGWFSPGVTDPERGKVLGRDRSNRIMFELTITAEDIDAFTEDPLHPATAAGYLVADQLGGRLPVERGWFNLFVADPTSGDARTPEVPARKMLYRLWLRDPGGTPLTFTGFKAIRNERGLDLWPDTTTLYATILRGHVQPEDDAPAEIAAAGMLYIRPLDFARQLTTFRASGPAPTQGLAAFGSLFLGELWKVYGRGIRRTPFPVLPRP